MKLTLPSRQRVLKFLRNFFIGLFIFYVFLGFIGIPWGIKWAVNNKVSPIINDHPISVQKVTFNPFTFRLNVHDFEIADLNKGQRLVAFEHFDFNFGFWALFKKIYRCQNISFKGLYIHPVVSAEGQLNLLGLIPEAKEEVVEEPEPEPEPEEEEQGLPKVVVDSFELIDGVIHVQDKTIQHPFKHAFRPINLRLVDLSTIVGESSDLGVTILMADEGKINVLGDVQVDPLSAKVKFAIEKMSLSSLQAYLDNYLNIRLDDGLLYFTGEVVYDAAEEADESLTFNGQTMISQFKLSDVQTNDVILGWEDFFVAPIDFSLDQKQLKIGQIIFNGLQSQFVLEPDGTNIQRALVKQEVQEVQEKVPEEKEIPEDSGEQVQKEEEAAEEFVVTLGEFILHNGKVSIADQTTTPSFSTALEQLDAKVVGITTQKDSQVELKVTGAFDHKGELDLEGRVQPFADPLNVELSFKLNNYEMDVLTPYVGKFTGLAVDDGSINLNIDYTIAENNIKANHKVLIQKFEFGEKVESEDALKLPFKLALSLLKDVSGKIKITLPVKGDLNDPEFKYAHLVGQTFTNFILKIVTKPFSFLASVIGAESGEEEFSYVRFIPGNAQLSPEEQAKLLKIAQAFKERPLLKMEVPGVYDTKDDWWAIKTQSFDRDYNQLLKEYSSSPEDVLVHYYKKVFGIPEYRRIYREFKNKNPKEWRKSKKEDLNKELRRQLIENSPADKEALNLLAQERAQNVINLFTQQGNIEEARVKIGASKEVEVSLDRIPMELTLITD